MAKPTMADLFSSIEKKLKYSPVPASERFGVRGDGLIEEGCPLITVWARVCGVAFEERLRFCFPRETPLKEVKNAVAEALGSEVGQSCFVDERGYRFSVWDTERPVGSFSSNCKLHVDLTYHLNDHMETAKGYYSESVSKMLGSN